MLLKLLYDNNVYNLNRTQSMLRDVIKTNNESIVRELLNIKN